MVAPPGQRDQPQVAVEHDGLGFARDAGKPEPAGALALGHHPVAGQRRVGAVVHDERAEVFGVGERPAHRLRALDRARPVAEGDRAGLGEQADFRDLASFEPFGDRRRRLYAHASGVVGAAQDEVDDRGIIDRRMSVGTRARVVTPPAAAAALALAIVSRCSAPGSPMKARISTSPGATTSPAQSMRLASSGGSAAETWAQQRR